MAEEVPIPSGTSQGTATTQTNFTYRDDIGIVLEVTPSVNPDGLVNMTVVPSITTRTGETVQISEDLFPEVFATRSASTRVAVLNGQTIVIGGLIEDQLKDTVKKVPILGDIPLAGMLFERSIKEKTKTELLIFLTPHCRPEAGGADRHLRGRAGPEQSGEGQTDAPRSSKSTWTPWKATSRPR